MTDEKTKCFVCNFSCHDFEGNVSNINPSAATFFTCKLVLKHMKGFKKHVIEQSIAVSINCKLIVSYKPSRTAIFNHTRKVQSKLESKLKCKLVSLVGSLYCSTMCIQTQCTCFQSNHLIFHFRNLRIMYRMNTTCGTTSTTSSTSLELTPVNARPLKAMCIHRYLSKIINYAWNA